ncbi:unnamed protein product [Lathyrus sativus]|nr:unnamed protein product [Lathyrus sativus]
MDTNECQPLHADILRFYKSINMKLDQQVPLLLVERQALNEAREGEENDMIAGKKIVLAFQTLGVVFGDVGTSPLYTFSVMFGMH